MLRKAGFITFNRWRDNCHHKISRLFHVCCTLNEVTRLWSHPPYLYHEKHFFKCAPLIQLQLGLHTQSGHKGNITISSFTYPYRVLSHLWFTLLLRSFSSELFHRRLSAWIRLFVSPWDETELHSHASGEQRVVLRIKPWASRYLFLLFGGGTGRLT